MTPVNLKAHIDLKFFTIIAFAFDVEIRASNPTLAADYTKMPRNFRNSPREYASIAISVAAHLTRQVGDLSRPINRDVLRYSRKFQSPKPLDIRSHGGGRRSPAKERKSTRQHPRLPIPRPRNGNRDVRKVPQEGANTQHYFRFISASPRNHDGMPFADSLRSGETRHDKGDGEIRATTLDIIWCGDDDINANVESRPTPKPRDD